MALGCCAEPGASPEGCGFSGTACAPCPHPPTQVLRALILPLFSALAVTFRPDGAELAVATLNAQITFWDPEDAVQTGSIEGRHDLKTGRRELDKVTAKHSAKGR